MKNPRMMFKDDTFGRSAMVEDAMYEADLIADDYTRADRTFLRKVQQEDLQENSPDSCSASTSTAVQHSV